MKTTGNMPPRPFILILSLLVVAPILERAAVLAEVSGGWIITSSMNIPRDEFGMSIGVVHTATLLPNGKVLVVGGLNRTGLVSSAQFYNPTTGMGSITASLNTARRNHTATSLLSGKVIGAGGFTGDGFCPWIDLVTANANLYDPVTTRWNVTENLNTACALRTAKLLENGKILVPRGIDGEDEEEDEDEEEEEPTSEYVPPASADLYDADTGSWSVTDSTARNSHTVTFLPGYYPPSCWHAN